MPVIEIPQLRATDILAVQIEQSEVAGSPRWVVTFREQHSGAVCRRWFADELCAVAQAAEQADRLGFLLIDLRDPGMPL